MGLLGPGAFLRGGNVLAEKAMCRGGASRGPDPPDVMEGPIICPPREGAGRVFSSSMKFSHRPPGCDGGTYRPLPARVLGIDKAMC